MKEVIQVMDAGHIPGNNKLMFVRDLDGQWWKYKITDDCTRFKDARDQGKLEPVTEAWAKSHVWPVSFGAGSLRVAFGIEIVNPESLTHEIRHF